MGTVCRYTARFCLFLPSFLPAFLFGWVGEWVGTIAAWNNHINEGGRIGARRPPPYIEYMVWGGGGGGVGKRREP